MVIANFNGVLMNKRFWDDPEVFRPDRFIDAEGKVFVPDNYLPFGYGNIIGLISSITLFSYNTRRFTREKKYKTF